MMNGFVSTAFSAGVTLLGLALTVQQGAPEAVVGGPETAPERQEIWLRSGQPSPPAPLPKSGEGGRSQSQNPSQALGSPSPRLGGKGLGDGGQTPVLELKSRSSARRPKSQKIKVKLELERPEDLAVKEGDRVLAGEVLADQSATRRGLELQKQQLVISIDQMAVPVASIGELPPPDFGVEESAIAAAQSTIATMEAAPEKRTRFTAPELTEAWDEDVAEWNWQVKAKQVESQVEMNRAVAQYQRAQSSYAWQQYQHGLNLQRQQETRQRQQFQVASLQADLWAVEQKLRELTTVRSPYDGMVQRVKVLGQQGRMLQVELTLLAEIGDAEG